MLPETILLEILTNMVDRLYILVQVYLVTLDGANLSGQGSPEMESIPGAR
jgi:hypothetical protein